MMYELRIDPESGEFREHRKIATTNPLLEAINDEESKKFWEHWKSKIGPFVGGYLGPSMIFDGYFSSKSFAKLPHPKHVLVNGDYTTVVWEDGSNTVVKKMAGEAYDFEKAIMYAIFKHMFYNEGAETKRYLMEFEDKTIVKKEKKNDRKRNNRKGKSKN